MMKAIVLQLQCLLRVAMRKIKMYFYIIFCFFNIIFRVKYRQTMKNLWKLPRKLVIITQLSIRVAHIGGEETGSAVVIWREYLLLRKYLMSEAVESLGSTWLLKFFYFLKLKIIFFLIMKILGLINKYRS